MRNLMADTRLDVGEHGEVAYSGSASSVRSDEAVAPSTASMKPNMGFWRIAALTLAVFGIAANANAGVQLYSGEMIVHTRGSDVAGNFIAIPFGAHCNTRPYHAARVATFTTGMGVFTLSIPKFGGQVPVIDTDADGFPDVASGCAPASLHTGLPLTGSGSLATTGMTSTARTVANPRGFTMPKSGISRMTSGASFLNSESTWLPLLSGTARFNFEIEYADLRNDAGVFGKGAGPGNFTISHAGTRAKVTAGSNQFGGTMRLLGQYRTNRGLELATTSQGETPWNLQYIGAGASTMAGVVKAGFQYTATETRGYYYFGKVYYSPRTATISVFPWTTGVAEVTAMGGPQSTILKRTGYDNRTAGGAGNIQLVSPSLTRWKNSYSDYYTGSIATIKLTFIPEPDAWMMLASGIGALVLLYRVNSERV